MRTQSSDTSPTAEALQIKLLREASVAKRLRLACSLSQTAAWLSREGLARSQPTLGERELDLMFLRLHYGERTAQWIRSCMKGDVA